MRRGLLTDYGGVLTTSVFESFRAFARAEGLEEDAVVHLFLEDEQALAELHRLERGEVTEDQLAATLAALLGISPERLADRLFAATRPDERMIAAVDAARAAGVRTALVSNSWGLGIYRRARHVLDRFDALLISGELGMRKPEPEILLLAAERVGLPPSSCVFVDDLPSNCAAATALGMAAVRHRSAAETIPQLERLLGVSLA